ncbi:GDSL-type esterase/lipase family protein [Longibaculum muris]|uniref:GDSL-type esterase/lipase family protein n=1 Tax=Longibaculum muris TaxID=1796628 RepID=UPI0022E7C375|nr:GDSL-type esterase/lipase family protein [Longibaculum muris]
MKKHKTLWVGMICAFVPILITIFLILFVFNQVGKMGENEILHKTQNYEQLSQDSLKETTVFFGDSITELCPVEDLYAAYTRKTGVPIINRGISAETTDSMLKRIEKTVLVMKPKNLVMLMGINDIAAKVDNQQIVNNIKQMITLTKQQSPKTHIILQAVYPINKTDRESLFDKFQLRDRDNHTIDELNEMLESLAKEEKITFLNVNSYLMDKNKELKKEYTFDGLHPNMQGYLAIRDAILNVLD